jgi:hypothetical protein
MVYHYLLPIDLMNYSQNKSLQSIQKEPALRGNEDTDDRDELKNASSLNIANNLESLFSLVRSIESSLAARRSSSR